MGSFPGACNSTSTSCHCRAGKRPNFPDNQPASPAYLPRCLPATRWQGAEYELRAQLSLDLQTMPVEDASVPWPADQSPHQPVAKLVIPAQEAYSPARRVFADDVLSFNPFHCLPEHQPLGSINRARIKAYESSAAYRHHMNAQPRLEPRDISTLPD